nr:DUF3192 domain-containing protein [Desulfobulbaceae bacterium]
MKKLDPHFLYRATMKKINLLTIVCLSILLNGCGVMYQNIADTNKENISNLAVGMSIIDALTLFKSPYLDEKNPVVEVETYTNFFGQKIDVLMNYTYRIADGKITDDELTPIVFKNESYIGYGHEFYNKLKDDNARLVDVNAEMLKRERDRELKLEQEKKDRELKLEQEKRERERKIEEEKNRLVLQGLNIDLLEVDKPFICNNEPACKKAFTLTQIFISEQAGMKIQLATDAIIETYGSKENISMKAIKMPSNDNH